MCGQAKPGLDHLEKERTVHSYPYLGGCQKGRRRRRKRPKTALPTLPAEQGGPDEASHNAASEAMTAILQEGAELE